MKKQNIQAVIYTSNTGYTEKYAHILGEKTGLPVYSIDESKALSKGTSVIYLGWLMAGGIKGYYKAKRKFDICAVCAVGMVKDDKQTNDVKMRHNIPDNVAFFALQGGFDINKLNGIYKFMMNIMKNTVGKELSDKPNRTAEEEIMLEMLINGGDYVCEKNIEEVLFWYEKTKYKN